MAWGVQALGIERGDAVLIPAYNCGVEIDPILHLGIKPVFYNIGTDCRINFDDLLSKITNGVKAILVTHFFGFPQFIDRIKEICGKTNLYLIEDCAHSFLSTYKKKPLGSYGDVGVFSLLKTLPVPNGGVLVINNKNIIRHHLPQKPNLFATFYYASELLRYRTTRHGNSIKENSLSILSKGVYLSLSFMRLILAGYRKYLNPGGLYLIKPDSYLFVKELCSWGISGLSRSIIDRTDFENIRITRRKNFEFLLSHFLKNNRGILPFNSLPDGICPLFFPLVVESPEMRERIYTTLKRKGIISYPWWERFHPSVPWGDFPDAVHLKQRLFGLPIHQNLTLDHLNYVLGEFENAF